MFEFCRFFFSSMTDCRRQSSLRSFIKIHNRLKIGWKRFKTLFAESYLRHKFFKEISCGEIVMWRKYRAAKLFSANVMCGQNTMCAELISLNCFRRNCFIGENSFGKLFSVKLIAAKLLMAKITMVPSKKKEGCAAFFSPSWQVGNPTPDALCGRPL